MNYCNHVRRFTTSLTLAAINHYDALGITPKATQVEVKSAYYNLSKVYHPDKNQGSAEAATKFRDITAAYEVLGNVRLRKLYDKGIDFKGSTHVYPHPFEEDDPALRFYKSREYRSRPPTGTGRTPFYDFDEWSRAHYGTTFARDMDRKRDKQERIERIKMYKEQSRIEAISYMVFFLMMVLMLILTDRSYDKDVYVKTENNNPEAKSQ